MAHSVEQLQRNHLMTTAHGNYNTCKH